MTESDAAANDLRASTAELPLWRQTWRLLRVRLRFVAVLAALALIIGKWDAWSTHVNRWLDRWVGTAWSGAGRDGVSPDTEYFCPMCPGVLSGWPDTCPICNMPLVRRKKGEAVILPSGVLARMQFSTQRIQLAGLHSTAVTYRPLVYRRVGIGRVVTVGPNNTRRLQSQVMAREAATLAACERVEVWSDAAPGASPRSGRIVGQHAAADADDFRVLELELSDATDAELLPGATVRVEFLVPVASVEPFRTEPRGVPEWTANEPRKAFLCPDHLEHVHVSAGKCPHDSKPLLPWPLAENQRIRWRCATHPDVLAIDSQAKCERCVDHPLAPAIVTFAPPGEVLAIPVSAVIDTGRETLVYIESGPGMFDGVKVRVGERAGDMYPVLEGVVAGQRVVTRGAFLVDAEARLNPALASTYFGAGGSSTSSAEPALAPRVETSRAKTPVEPSQKKGDVREVRRLLAKFDMPSADRQLAEQQGTCPVTGMPLGSMGKPPKKVVDGKPVFICCEGCSSALPNSLRKRKSSDTAHGETSEPVDTKARRGGADRP